MIEGLTTAGLAGVRAVAESSPAASEAATLPGPRETQDGPARLSGGSGAAKDPRELARAAEEFESLLLAQILRMVREAGSGGWLGSSGKQGVNPAMELAEAELARALARGGALGISQLVVKDLAPSSPDESSKPGPVEGGR